MRREIAAISMYSMAAMAVNASPLSAQEAMTAGSLGDHFTNREESAYLAGVIEGLGYARFLKDDKDETGMKCIKDWFYDGEGTQAKILDAFDLYPDYPVGPILWALSKQQCGE